VQIKQLLVPHLRYRQQHSEERDMVKNTGFTLQRSFEEKNKIIFFYLITKAKPFHSIISQ